MRTPTGKIPFAKKSLGQNFLTDDWYISRIIAALHPVPGDTIVEIGPGRGALTEKLIDTGARVVAIEIDRNLVQQLTERFGSNHKFYLSEADALDVRFDQEISLAGGSMPAKLVANLPYNISTPILQRLVGQNSTFSELVLMFQREVVERLAAVPGTSDRGFLTVLVEAHFVVERLFDVHPKAFRPVPKVWSSVVRLTPRLGVIVHVPVFRELVSVGFGQKRKTILNNLKRRYSNAADLLTASGIDPKSRAEDLTLKDWYAIAGHISTTSPDNS